MKFCVKALLGLLFALKISFAYSMQEAKYNPKAIAMPMFEMIYENYKALPKKPFTPNEWIKIFPLKEAQQEYSDLFSSIFAATYYEDETTDTVTNTLANLYEFITETQKSKRKKRFDEWFEITNNTENIKNNIQTYKINIPKILEISGQSSLQSLWDMRFNPKKDSTFTDLLFPEGMVPVDMHPQPQTIREFFKAINKINPKNQITVPAEDKQEDLSDKSGLEPQTILPKNTEPKSIFINNLQLKRLQETLESKIKDPTNLDHVDVAMSTDKEVQSILSNIIDNKEWAKKPAKTGKNEPIIIGYWCLCNKAPISTRIIFIKNLVEKIKEKHKDREAKLIYTSFGSGSFFQDYLTIKQLLRNGYKNISVNLIEPAYADKKSQESENFERVKTKLLREKQKDEIVEITQFNYAHDYISSNKKSDVFVAVDLDALPTNYDSSKINTYNTFIISTIDMEALDKIHTETQIGNDPFTTPPWKSLDTYAQNEVIFRITKSMEDKFSNINIFFNPKFGNIVQALNSHDLGNLTNYATPADIIRHYFDNADFINQIKAVTKHKLMLVEIYPMFLDIVKKMAKDENGFIAHVLNYNNIFELTSENLNYQYQAAPGHQLLKIKDVSEEDARRAPGEAVGAQTDQFSQKLGQLNHNLKNFRTKLNMLKNQVELLIQRLKTTRI